VRPARENAPSDGVLVAGTDNTDKATVVSFGKNRFRRTVTAHQVLVHFVVVGGYYQQQSSYPVNFSAGKLSTILQSPAGIAQQHFPHPWVPSILISLPAGNPHILFP